MSQESNAPVVLVLGGSNGAGKSTISRDVIADVAGVQLFVNADVIATGLSGFEPEAAAFEAGKIMLTRLHALAERRASFAFETTLASRSFASWLRKLKASGYHVFLVYVWLRSADLAVQRVSIRVQKGGHAIPEETIRRRYTRAISNFFNLYAPLADTWRVYDNSLAVPKLIARCHKPAAPIILSPELFSQFQQAANATQADAPEKEPD